MSTDEQKAMKIAGNMLNGLVGRCWRELPADAQIDSGVAFERLVQALVHDRQQACAVLNLACYRAEHPSDKHARMYAALVVELLRRTRQLTKSLNAVSGMWVCRHDGLYVQIRPCTKRVERLEMVIDDHLDKLQNVLSAESA